MSRLNTANHKCVYVNCTTSKRIHRDVTLFKFPVRNAKRAVQWQINCGNILIARMDVDALKAKLVCEKHFLPGDFLINNRRKLLTKTAVPVMFVKEEPPEPPEPPEPLDETAQPEFVNVEPRTYEKTPKLSSIASDPISLVSSPSTSLAASCSVKDEQELLDTPTILQVADGLQSNSPQTRLGPGSIDLSDDESKVSESILQRMASPTEATLVRKCETCSVKFKAAKRKMKALQSQTYRLKKKVAKFSTEAVMDDLLQDSSPAAKTFVNMQLFHRKKGSWSKAEKNLALSLHAKSAATYKFMFENLKFVLPSVRTIQEWLQVKT